MDFGFDETGFRRMTDLIHDRYYWVNDPQRTEPVVMRFTRAGNERGTLRAWMHAIDEHRFDEIEIQGPLEIPFDE